MADFSARPRLGLAPLEVTFSDLSSGDITSWTWIFGDGGVSFEQNPVHVYSAVAAFNYDVSLTVTGPGGSDTLLQSQLVTIMEPDHNEPKALSSIAVPLPSQLGAFVTDMDAAVALGKALFWDVQAGSDGLTACASCHFQAGADGRIANRLNPGPDGLFSTLSSGGGGPNHSLVAGDFPFHKFLDPNVGEIVVSSKDDIVGTAGVVNQTFAGVVSGSDFDDGTTVADPNFQIGGVNTLQVTGRDAPTVLGAGHLFRMFWDGRANHYFNGRSIWGEADTSNPTVLAMAPDGSLVDEAILLENAALASQAVGPPLSGVEMSWNGRSFNELGRKMLSLAPLSKQYVDPTDSVLGALANPTGNGLAGVTYSDMIEAAFAEKWWGSLETRDGFTHKEANFSLLWGLAILCYEATLMPDQTPYDAFKLGNSAALTEQQLRGKDIFMGRGNCIDCHGTPMFAGSVTHDLLNGQLANEGESHIEIMAMANGVSQGRVVFARNPVGNEILMTASPFNRRVRILDPEGTVIAQGRIPRPASGVCGPAETLSAPLTVRTSLYPENDLRANAIATVMGGCDAKLEINLSWTGFNPLIGDHTVVIGNIEAGTISMPPATAQATYDTGFYNIGVRPTAEDLGVGGNSPFGPLSFSRRIQNGDLPPFDPGSTGVSPDARIAVDGSFKAPTLRNIELTGPFMHNGSMATLREVVDFYVRGSDFRVENSRDLDPNVSGVIDMSEQDKEDLIAFMLSLTDERVRIQAAPFDHPELPLKVGHVGDTSSIVDDGTGNGLLVLETLPATGAAGGAPFTSFESKLPASLTVTAGNLSLDGRSGATAGFHVILDKRPSADVILELGASSGLVGVEPAKLVFTPEDWRSPREVTVTLLDGRSASFGDVTVRSVASRSADPEFSGLLLPEIDVRVLRPLVVGQD